MESRNFPVAFAFSVASMPFIAFFFQHTTFVSIMILFCSDVFQLMNFVETVHHGFFEEPEVFKRVPTRYKKDGKAIPRYQKDHQTVAGDEGLVGVHKTEPKALQMEESLEEESVPISEKDKSNEHKDVNSERSDSLNDFLRGDSGEDAITRGM